MSVVDRFLALATLPSPSEQEQLVAGEVRGCLEDLGLDIEEHRLPRSPDAPGNLLARLPATAPGIPLLFCAHLDTAPPAGPIVPTVQDGVISAATDTILGADDKAAVAVLLELAAAIVRQGVPHPGVELVFSVQEEIGLQGTKAFPVAQLGARAGFVFDDASPVGHVVVAAPYQENVEATFLGRAAHVGVAPQDGRSAILAAARAIAAMRLGLVAADTTANVGVIHGGTARNIVAAACEIEVDIRSLDGPAARALAQEAFACCEHAAADTGCELRADVFEGYPGYRLDPSDAPVRLACDALEACGHRPQIVTSGGGVDANVLNARGIPTVNLGNGMRDIHTPDESIAVRDLEAMLAVALGTVRAAAAERPLALPQPHPGRADGPGGRPASGRVA
jgi:tripeptide aminopeptidase